MLISVIIPVFNESSTIEDCLRSLQIQSRPADEIIIVDNNCTDDTIVKARKFNVRIIRETKQGIWPARTAGNNAAKGEILVSTDADARFPQTWLRDIERSFKQDPQIIAITGPGQFYDGPEFVNALADTLYMKAYFKLVGLALRTEPLFASNMAVKKSAWSKVAHSVHNADDRVHDDMDLSYHLLPLGKIKYLPRLVVDISIRPLKSPVSLIKRYPKAVRSIFIHWPEQAPWNLKK